MRLLSRLLLWLYDCFVFYGGLLVFGLICLLWSWLAVPLRLVLPKAPGRWLGRFMISNVFRLFFLCLELSGRFRFDLSEVEALRHEKSIIIAPNHPSLWDAILIASRLSDAACIMKTSIVYNHFLGGGARLAQYIPNWPLRSMVSDAVEDLNRGGQLLLFPEGTRTTTPPIGPLKGSIGIIAGRADVPVQTLIIETDTPFLRKGWPVFKKPALPMTYRVRLGRRFSGSRSSAALVAELEQYFSLELSKPPSLTSSPIAMPQPVNAD